MGQELRGTCADVHTTAGLAFVASPRGSARPATRERRAVAFDSHARFPHRRKEPKISMCRCSSNYETSRTRRLDPSILQGVEAQYASNLALRTRVLENATTYGVGPDTTPSP